MWIGIDFGTSYSSAALCDAADTPPQQGDLKLVRDPIKHVNFFPSSVYVKDNQILVGQAADNSARIDPSRYKKEFKRDLGTDTPYVLGGHHMMPEDLVAKVLQRIKEEAEKMHSHVLNDIVLTIPATYQEHKRELMKQAAQTAGFQRVELLAEPVAAAFYYSWHTQDQQAFQEGEIILVYDFGGGTFDATLIQKQGAGYHYLGQPEGIEYCGGIDFDREMYKDIKSQDSTLADRLNQQTLSGNRDRQVMVEWCRAFKHQLSETLSHEDVPPSSNETYHLTRQQFNVMIKPFVEQSMEICRHLIQKANLTWEQIDRVLLVGGSCRIPYVRETIERELGRSAVWADDPELAVCQGAAIYGAELAKKEQRPCVSNDGGWAKYITINEAIRQVDAHKPILVEPGTYHEKLLLDRPVEIVGNGLSQDIVIESEDSSCIYMQTDYAKVRHLSLRCRTGATQSSYAVDIPVGQLVLEDCDIVSESLACVAIHGSDAVPVIQNCKIHSSIAEGLIFYNEGQGVVKDCDIFGNSLAQIQITEGSNPTIEECRIHAGKQNGIVIRANGKGVIKECIISANAYSAIEISEGGSPHILKCTIQDGNDQGIFIHTDSGGVIEACDIFENSLAGIDIRDGSDPTIRHCQVHENKQQGIIVRNRSKGVIEKCSIYGNKLEGIEVSEKAISPGLPISHIRECDVYSNLGAGIAVRDETAATIESSRVFENEYANIIIERDHQTVVRSCSIYEGKDNGILIVEGGSPSLEQCTIYKNTLSGVAIAHDSGTALRQCKISEGKATGLFITEGSKEVLVDGCDISSNDGTGLVIDQKSQSRIQNCYIRNSGYHGLCCIDASADIVACEVSYNNLAGICLQEGGSYKIKHCRINRNYNEAVQVYDNVRGDIIECDVSDNMSGSWGIALKSDVYRKENFPPEEWDILNTLKSFGSQQDYYVHPDIPSDKLLKARERCKVPESEQVLALIDCTLFGSAKNSILLGQAGIYYHNGWTAKQIGSGNVSYSQFPERDFHDEGNEISLGNNQYVELNGSSVSMETVLNILNELKVLMTERKRQIDYSSPI
jgi:F-box protein 11